MGNQASLENVAAENSNDQPRQPISQSNPQERENNQNAENEMLQYLQEQPPEILALIFSFLGTADLVKFSCTCRDFYKFVNSEKVWKVKYMHEFKVYKDQNYPDLLGTPENTPEWKKRYFLLSALWGGSAKKKTSRKLMKKVSFASGQIEFAGPKAKNPIRRLQKWRAIGFSFPDDDETLIYMDDEWLLLRKILDPPVLPHSRTYNLYRSAKIVAHLKGYFPSQKTPQCRLSDFNIFCGVTPNWVVQWGK